MVQLAVPPHDPAAAIVDPSSKAEWLAASTAGIDAYLGAGDRMATIMDITGKVCIALIALIAVAWAIGVLPGAVRLFR